MMSTLAQVTVTFPQLEVLVVVIDEGIGIGCTTQTRESKDVVSRDEQNNLHQLDEYLWKQMNTD